MTVLTPTPSLSVWQQAVQLGIIQAVGGDDVFQLLVVPRQVLHEVRNPSLFQLSMGPKLIHILIGDLEGEERERITGTLSITEEERGSETCLLSHGYSVAQLACSPWCRDSKAKAGALSTTTQRLSLV